MDDYYDKPGFSLSFVASNWISRAGTLILARRFELPLIYSAIPLHENFPRKGENF